MSEFVNLNEVFLPIAGGTVDGDVEIKGLLLINDGSDDGTTYNVAEEIAGIKELIYANDNDTYIHSDDQICVDTSIRLPNAKYIYNKNVDGSDRNIIGTNSSNNLLVGYGGYSNEDDGGTYIYGNDGVGVYTNGGFKIYGADGYVYLEAPKAAGSYSSLGYGSYLNSQVTKIYGNTIQLIDQGYGYVLFNSKKGYLMQMGYVSITPSAANTPTSASVTFPYAFRSTPRVICSANSTVPGTRVKGVAARSPSTTGFTAYLTRTNTTETGIAWIAAGAL